MGSKQPTPPPVDDSAERLEQSQIIIDTALKRVRELGCSVVANGTVYGNEVLFDTLEARVRAKPTPPPWPPKKN